MGPGVVFGFAVVLLSLYLLCVERFRVGVTTFSILGLLGLYGLGFWYFAAVVPDLVPSIVDRMQFMFALGSCAFLLGVETVRWATSGGLKARHALIARWPVTPMAKEGEWDHWLVMIAFAVSAYMLATMLLTGRLSGLLNFFAQVSEAARVELRRTQTSGGYFYGLLLLSVGPFLSAVVLLRALVTKKALVITAAVTLCLVVFLARFATFTKSLWAIYLVQIILTLYVTRALTLPLTRMLVGAVLVVGMLFFGSWLIFPEASAGEILNFLVYRMVQITNEGIYQTLYVFPDYVPFSKGLNIGMLAAIAGYDVPAQAHFIVAEYFGAFGATFNTMFMSGAWVDFGWLGVAIVSFIVGVVVRFYDHFALSLGKTSLGCALLGFSVVPTDVLMATSAQTAMLSGGLLSIPVLVLFARPLLQKVSTRVAETHPKPVNNVA